MIYSIETETIGSTLVGAYLTSGIGAGKQDLTPISNFPR